MALDLDHLVVTAPDLAAGVATVETALGVGLTTGGQHARMGTHNALLRLGPACYLEVIAIDPQAPPPARPRWFGLDDGPTAPRLAHWLVASDDIVRDAPRFGFEPDEIVPMSRGRYRWRITVARDGRLPGDGGRPGIIQWDGEHPAAQLPDYGCRLGRLDVCQADAETLHDAWQAHGFADDRVRLTTAPPQLYAEIITPTGRRPLLAGTARD